LVWAYDKASTDETYRKVFIKWLRFCYGEDQTFTLKECPSALFILLQLELDCEGDVKEKIKKYMLNVAEKNVEEGVNILEKCFAYYDDCDKMKDACEALARTVFTQSNMEKKFEIVSPCLKKAPAFCLDIAVFGENHDEKGEVNVRVEYVKYNDKQLEHEEKLEVLRKCYGKKLTSDELEQLKELKLLKNEEIIEMRMKSTEIELQQAIKEMKEMKKELEEERKERFRLDAPQFFIENNTDFNKVLKPGTYCCQSCEVCKTLKNKPCMMESAFLLTVRCITSEWIQQEIISSENKRWTRQYQINGNGTVWSDWLGNSPTVLFNVRYSKKRDSI